MPRRPAAVRFQLVQRVLEHRFADAARLADHPAEPGDDLEGLTGLDEALEVSELLLEPARTDARAAHEHDLRVARRRDLLGLRPELLVQLLAGPHADLFDRDVPLGLL